MSPFPESRGLNRWVRVVQDFACFSRYSGRDGNTCGS
jgi:hypothetical protein